MERVRARVKPKFIGRCTDGCPSKREVSYIVSGPGGVKHWIEMAGIVEVKEPSTSKTKPATAAQAQSEAPAQTKIEQPKKSAPVKTAAIKPQLADTVAPPQARQHTPSKQHLPQAMPEVFKTNFEALKKFHPSNIKSL